MNARGAAVAGAGAVVAAAVAVWAWSGGPSGTTGPLAGGATPLAGPVLRPELGVRGGAVDPASRARTRSAPGSLGRASTAPERVNPREARPEEAPAPTPEPVPVDPRALAESEARAQAGPDAQAAVDAGLAARREAVRRECWTGDVPASASFAVEATYGAEGELLALSVGDSAEAPAVGACVREQKGLVPATIEAPGVGVTVQSTLSLP